MKIDQQVSNCIKQCILDVFQPSRIVIFGSYATDRATADSDIDIMAIVGDDQRSDHEAAVGGRLAIRTALQAIDKDMAFDFILSKQSFFNKARLMKGTMDHDADQQGVVIYDRQH